MQYSEFYLFLAAENNVEAKFLFAKKEIVLSDLLLYENWLGKAVITEASDLDLLNQIIIKKEIALQNKEFEWAGSYRASEINTVYQLSQVWGLAHNKLNAQRDFGDVRCYLLTSIMEKNDLHKGFEKMN